jgi:hypothetical protein
MIASPGLFLKLNQRAVAQRLTPHFLILVGEGTFEHQEADIVQQTGDKHLVGLFIAAFFRQVARRYSSLERMPPEADTVERGLPLLGHRIDRSGQSQSGHLTHAERNHRLRNRTDLAAHTVVGRIDHAKHPRRHGRVAHQYFGQIVGAGGIVGNHAEDFRESLG